MCETVLALCIFPSFPRWIFSFRAPRSPLGCAAVSLNGCAGCHRAINHAAGPRILLASADRGWCINGTARTGCCAPQRIFRSSGPMVSRQKRQGRAGLETRVRQHADRPSAEQSPSSAGRRYRPDALNQLHGALRPGRAGQDRGRRRAARSARASVAPGPGCDSAENSRQDARHRPAR